MESSKEIRPQPGFQEQFLASGADITIGGGAAGCGKTYIEEVAPLPWVHLKDFTAVLFRRTTVQITNPGGPWDQSMQIYPDFGATSTMRPLRWTFPSGATISMAHLEYEKDMFDWQGAQVALLIFDELTHFTEEQFWYLQSRNRSMCGIRPYTLGTCNPDPDSWVAKLIAWWLDDDGDPIPARSGVLRYFTRWQGEIMWGDTPNEVRAKLPPGVDLPDSRIQTLTFIPGKLEENKILEKADPTYRGKLEAMSRVSRARLLGGNWKARAVAGSYFRKSDVKILDVAPTGLSAVTRRWDLAASEPTEAYPDPDYTCGVKLGRYPDGRFVVLHAEMQRKRANEVRELVKRTSVLDGSDCSVGVPQDPAQAGKDQAESYVLDLAGFDVYTDKESGDKETRAEPCAAQWQHQNIDVVKGPWNDSFFAQLEAFPDPKVHDDAVDALDGAFKHLLEEPSAASYFRKTR